MFVSVISKCFAPQVRSVCKQIVKRECRATVKYLTCRPVTSIIGLFSGPTAFRERALNIYGRHVGIHGDRARCDGLSDGSSSPRKGHINFWRGEGSLKLKSPSFRRIFISRLINYAYGRGK